MAYTFTRANAKGGCGKTTVALNLAICFTGAGYRTLAIDLDQQGNLSAGLGVDLNELSSTAHRLLINEAPEIRRYLIEIRPQLKLLPNSDYQNAQTIVCPICENKAGDLCPACGKGRLRQLLAEVVIRFRGNPPITTDRYERERVRCDTCGQVYKAELPEKAGDEKYDASAKASIVMSKYGSGVPFRMWSFQISCKALHPRFGILSSRNPLLYSVLMYRLTLEFAKMLIETPGFPGFRA